MKHAVRSKHRIRRADQNRGPRRYPHWHDGKAWEQHTDMTLTRLRGMTADEFVEYLRDRDKARAFFYASRWPEGFRYSENENWVRLTCYPGLLKHPQNWPTSMLGDEKPED